jgi:hypothetical protein
MIPHALPTSVRHIPSHEPDTIQNKLDPQSRNETIRDRAPAIIERPATIHSCSKKERWEDLRWWLLGFGDGVEVEAPARLRREVAGTARRCPTSTIHDKTL